MSTFPVTVYSGATNPVPVAQEYMDWPRFCRDVADMCLNESSTTDKKYLPAFGPYRLRAGATRSIAGVEVMSQLVALDLDGANVDALKARIQELNVTALVHGSPSDDPNGVRKVRVYLLADGLHVPADAGALRDSVAAVLGVTHDPYTRNADRIFFCGRLKGTPPREVWWNNGSLVPLAQLPRVAPPVSARDAASGASAEMPADPQAGDRAREAASYAILGALGPWTDYPGRKHATCGALGGMLRKADWSEAQCADIIRAWLPKNDPSVDVEAGVRWACSAWNKPPEEVSGKAALELAVGKQIAGIIEESSMLPWRTRRGLMGPEIGQSDPGTGPRQDLGGDRPLVEWVNIEEPPPVLSYIVPGLDLAPGKVNVIQGFAYTAKTPFALLLSICIASGHDFLGIPVKQAPAMYLDFEGGVLTQERVARLCAGLGISRKGLPLIFGRADGLSEAMIAHVEEQVRLKGVRSVMVDTYTSALPPEVLTFNDGGFRVWANFLARMGERTDAMMTLLAHENKAANGREGLRGIGGHSSFSGAVQAGIALSRPDPDDKHLIEVNCSRAARYGFNPFCIRWTDVECEEAPTGMALVATRVDMEPEVKEEKPGRNTKAAADRLNGRVPPTDAEIARSIFVMFQAAPTMPIPRRTIIQRAGGYDRPVDAILTKLFNCGVMHAEGSQYSIMKGAIASLPPHELERVIFETAVKVPGYNA